MKFFFRAYGSNAAVPGSAVQNKSFLHAKSFLKSPLNITPYKSLNTSRGVVSEPDLLYTSEAEILDVFSDQGVIQLNSKSLTSSTTTQTNQTITKIVCPLLKLLQPLISVPKPTMSSRIPTVTKSSISTQAYLLPSTSVAVTMSSESQPPILLIDTASATSNSL
ncbi:hypothetical protein TNCV_1872371 [Trichonephila clavipes]|nr:hypothetical protein TNCV_1872371 [Trichonephila clavipes]